MILNSIIYLRFIYLQLLDLFNASLLNMKSIYLKQNIFIYIYMCGCVCVRGCRFKEY